MGLDPVAYPKLTDAFVEARLVDREIPALEPAAAEYDKRIVRRQMMRLVADWDLPRPGDEGMATAKGPLPLPDREVVIAAVHKLYLASAKEVEPTTLVREVTEKELRCQVASFSYG